MKRLLPVMVLLAAACQQDEDVKGYDRLVRHVGEGRVGADRDQWIEMLNLGGEWEKTALVFGYVDDAEECAKALDGFRRANPARRYRCAPASQPEEK